MRQKSKKDWFVLCTKVRQELKVLERLNKIVIVSNVAAVGINDYLY
jgi:hypothetical protein